MASQLGIQWQGLLNSGGNTNIFAGTNPGTGGQNIINLTGAVATISEQQHGRRGDGEELVPDVAGLNLGVVNRAARPGRAAAGAGQRDAAPTCCRRRT